MICRDIFIRGARGALNFDNRKRSKIWYMSREVAKARQSIFEYFFKPFFVFFSEISGPLSHAAYTERSTIVDLLIKIPGPLITLRHTEGPQFC